VKPLVIGSFAKGHLTYQWPAMMKHVLGTKYQVITGYRSGSDCNLAMERGEIHGWAASWENLAGTRPQWIAEKKVSVLVSFTFERKKQIPDVPTLLELGYPKLHVSDWQGIVAPAATPAKVIYRLHGEIERSLRSVDTQQRLETLGMEAAGAGPKEFAAHIQNEVQRWSKLVREAGIKAE
jgi:tripartite-type tricarboxylate transporter receptor subunit TctC